jgi:hypothetical protein
MIRPDVNGKLWHKGTKLGVIYSLIVAVIFGVTTTQDPDGSLLWLEKFSFLLYLAPFAAASHGYFAGQASILQAEDKSGNDQKSDQ